MLRRIVAGHKDGKSSFIADGIPTKVQVFKSTPGMGTAWIWATPANPKITRQDPAEGFSRDLSFLPKLGETRFIYLQVAPESAMTQVDFDAKAAADEMNKLQPEMMALMEPDHPGMHRTESIDYVIVLDGNIYLELDDGQELLLSPHDVVIQTGTRHAWHNRSSKPVLLAVILIGAARDRD